MSFARKHSPLYGGEAPAHGSIEYPIPNAYHYPAEDSGVGPEVRADLPTQSLGEPIYHLLLRTVIGLVGEGHARVHAVQLLIEQHLVLLRDLRQKPLAAPPKPTPLVQDSGEPTYVDGRPDLFFKDDNDGE